MFINCKNGVLMEEKKLVTVSAIAVLAIIIVIIIGSNNGGNFTVFAILNPPACENVQVPYEVQEPYEVVEEHKSPLRYEVTSVEEGLSNNYKTLAVRVKNVDIQGAVFTVRMYFKPLKGIESVKESKQYISPGETKTFYQEYSADSAEDVNARYVVIVDQKIEARTTTKYRTVIMYRPEEKCT